MATITLTPADLRAGSIDAEAGCGEAGATIEPGYFLYLDPADDKLKLSDNSSAIKADAIAIATTYALSTEAVSFIKLKSGEILNSNGTPYTASEDWVISATGGKLFLASELTTGHFVTNIGVSPTTAQLLLAISASGVAMP